MDKLSLRDSISADLMITSNMLNRMIARAPYSYKTYQIHKRSGGLRTISQPAKETKYLQRWLIDNIFQQLPIHGCATAYKDKSGIKFNAHRHKGNTYIVKFDFKNFFTSIKMDHVVMHLDRYLNGMSNEDIKDISRICCISYKGQVEKCLSIGAPSSPIISNTIMYDFDCMVSDWASKNDFTYTRYADDLTFSTHNKGVSSVIEPVLREIVHTLNYPALRFNNKKTVHLSKKHKRNITGLILTNDGEVSVGRKKKREISSLIHKFSHNSLPEEKVYYLQGLLGFINDVEPQFLSRLRGKYGSNLISTILKAPRKDRKQTRNTDQT